MLIIHIFKSIRNIIPNYRCKVNKKIREKKISSDFKCFRTTSQGQYTDKKHSYQHNGFRYRRMAKVQRGT